MATWFEVAMVTVGEGDIGGVVRFPWLLVMISIRSCRHTPTQIDPDRRNLALVRHLKEINSEDRDQINGAREISYGVPEVSDGLWPSDQIRTRA